jgi:hypothetical protein
MPEQKLLHPALVLDKTERGEAETLTVRAVLPEQVPAIPITE